MSPNDALAINRRDRMIVERCLAGDSYRVIAADLEISYERVRQIFRLRHAGAEKPVRRKPHKRMERVERICKLDTCENVFRIRRTSTQEYCSHACWGQTQADASVWAKRRRAYRLRASGLAWADVADQIGASNANSAVMYAKRAALTSGWQWPIRLRGHEGRWGGYVRRRTR